MAIAILLNIPPVGADSLFSILWIVPKLILDLSAKYSWDITRVVLNSFNVVAKSLVYKIDVFCVSANIWGEPVNWLCEVKVIFMIHTCCWLLMFFGLY